MFEQLGGMVTVRIEGTYVEKVLNMAMARGVFISDVRKESNGASLRVRYSGFDALQNICEENGFQIHIVSKQGLPVVKKLFRRRIGFLSGSIFFILALYILSSFIWFVDVQGNQKVSTQQIFDTAAQYGICPGKAKWTFDRIEVENALLRDINQLSYVKLNIKGVSIHIEVVEKTYAVPEVTGPCHIIANSAGVVEDMLVLTGAATVKVGDVVRAGDILITGIVVPQPNPYGLDDPAVPLQPYLVRARGSVKAKIWHEGYGECRLRNEQLVFTGAKQVHQTLITPWSQEQDTELIPAFPLSVTEYKEKVWNTPWGRLGSKRAVEQEQQIEVIEYSPEEAKQIAAGLALQQLGLSPELTSDSNYRSEVVSAPSDPILRVSVMVEIIEEIGTVQPIP